MRFSQIYREIRNLGPHHITARYGPITGEVKQRRCFCCTGLTTGVEDGPNLKSKPDCIVNVGVANDVGYQFANKVLLEEIARNSPYVREDVNGLTPADNW